ncbi:hypothetical protein M3P05_10940 [Sansalvadorimonas sp. 2012CJ34-2]|uniref:Uncharacterized protein n=1 Tax=Parendozoicomonas callyspongiae TaxID=2942213 RepID=A0ABT0PGR8_9GAMM|nr:hypothetical protein [Sansalvadorimonas sp. 2012CJ34-2]MCL6270436.1 hypothetical protein [Sansalvadorimonas sp. 2012CJ34-2]
MAAPLSGNRFYSPSPTTGPSDNSQKYGKMADYLVEKLDLHDEGTFRQIARQCKSSGYDMQKGKPNAERIITILSQLEPALHKEGKQLSVELRLALTRLRAFQGTQKQEFTEMFVNADQGTPPKANNQPAAESQVLSESAMTTDRYSVPYYPCNDYDGPLFNDAGRVILNIRRDSGDTTTHSGTTTILNMDSAGKVLLPDTMTRDNRIIRTNKILENDTYKPDGTYTEQQVIKFINNFWQDVFSEVDTALPSRETCDADFMLVIDGKVTARQARQHGRMLTDQLSANLMQDLPRVIVATTKEAGFQFTSDAAKVQVDLVEMLKKKHITIYNANEALVRKLGHAALRVMFGDRHQTIGQPLSTAPTSENSRSAVLSPEEVISIADTLSQTQSLLRHQPRI